MNIKPLVFGAVAAFAVTVPVVASTVGESSPSWTVQREPLSAPQELQALALPRDLGDVQMDIKVAATGGTGSSSGSGVGVTGTNTGSSGTVFVGPAPVEPLPVRARPVNHVAHVVPAVRTEEVANTNPVVFDTGRLWVIGSFR